MKKRLSLLILLSFFLVACLAVDLNVNSRTRPKNHLTRRMSRPENSLVRIVDETVAQPALLDDGVNDRNTRSNSQLVTWKQALAEDPKLFVGCSKIFLDVGSNRGTHVRKLFEPQKYPDCPYMSFFDQGFGTADDRVRPSTETGICAFGFEANPEWASTLHQIEQAYKVQGWRAKWFAPGAVGDARGNMTFWNNDAGANSDWGFGIKKGGNTSTQVIVPVMDLSDFMEQLNKTAPSGYRLMKMDIESAEYMVLPPFLRKQLLCQNVLNMLTIEWHDRSLTSEASKQHAVQLERQVNSSSKCASGPSTNVTAFDDESYGNDGMPLPTTWWWWLRYLPGYNASFTS